jgi:GT2 family glycosyltransferase
MDKILFVITTYNQLRYTEMLFTRLSAFKLSSPEIVSDIEIDILIVDDASTDVTVNWCTINGINIIKKDKGKGLTHSWNEGYKYFRDNKEYKYIIISNNDVLVPKGAIKEMVEVFKKWPFSLVVPMSSVAGGGHNGQVQGIENVWAGTPAEWVNDPKNYQSVQRDILAQKKVIEEQNNLYQLDPARMKMFNGFFFMMNRNIINYEREDGLLFNSEKLMYQGEDEFNWATLIPNNDFPALCKTAFVFHYKGMSTKGFSQIKNDVDKWEELRKQTDKKQESGYEEQRRHFEKTGEWL